MIDTPQLTTTQRHLAAVIHLRIPRSEMQTVMGPAIHELIAAIGDQGRAVTGSMFCHHLTMPTEAFDLEVGFPVDGSVTANGRVKSSELPGAPVVWTTYKGPYEGLPTAWKEFGEWVKSHGHAGNGRLWESYVSGPETDPDPETFCTELYLPLAAP